MFTYGLDRYTPCIYCGKFSYQRRICNYILGKFYSQHFQLGRHELVHDGKTKPPWAKKSKAAMRDSCYRTYAHFNKNCSTEFAGSRTIALRIAELLHVLLVTLHFVINYLLFTLSPKHTKRVASGFY